MGAIDARYEIHPNGTTSVFTGFLIMLLKKKSLRTTSRSLLLISVSFFIAQSWLIFFDTGVLKTPFLWSAQLATTLAPTSHSFEISNVSCNTPNPRSYPLHPPGDPHLHGLIRRYIKFHARERACLLDPSCKRVPKLLVATCIDKFCFGLGDRMRGLLFSFTIALITNRVLFVHELSEMFPLESGLAPYAIDWTLPSTVIYNDSWPHLQWQRCSKSRKCNGNRPDLTDFPNFDNVGAGINMLTDDIRKVFGDRPVASISSRNRFSRLRFILTNPHLMEEYGDVARYLLDRKMNFYRLMFQPSLPVSEMMKDVEFNDDYLSVHIRTGIDANESMLERFSYWSSHEAETVESAFQCIKKVSKDTKRIFLASDSMNTKGMFKRMAKKHGYEVHLFDEETAHYSKARHKIGKNGWNELCKGSLMVFSDLFMLSRGKIMIETGSHFSGLAWAFSRDQQVFSLRSDSECEAGVIKI